MRAEDELRARIASMEPWAHGADDLPLVRFYRAQIGILRWALNDPPAGAGERAGTPDSPAHLDGPGVDHPAPATEHTKETA